MPPLRVDRKKDHYREPGVEDSLRKEKQPLNFGSGKGGEEHLKRLEDKLRRLHEREANGIPVDPNEFGSTQTQIEAIRKQLYGESDQDSHGTD